jgi:hypothetical protein
MLAKFESGILIKDGVASAPAGLGTGEAFDIRMNVNACHALARACAQLQLRTKCVKGEIRKTVYVQNMTQDKKKTLQLPKSCAHGCV